MDTNLWLRAIYSPKCNLSTTQRCVLAALLTHANGHGECWPSINRLCGCTGLTRKTIINTIKVLEAIGIITTNKGKRRSTTYTLVSVDLVHPTVESVHLSQRMANGGLSTPRSVTITPRSVTSTPVEVEPVHPNYSDELTSTPRHLVESGVEKEKQEEIKNNISDLVDTDHAGARALFVPGRPVTAADLEAHFWGELRQVPNTKARDSDGKTLRERLCAVMPMDGARVNAAIEYMRKKSQKISWWALTSALESEYNGKMEDVPGAGRVPKYQLPKYTAADDAIKIWEKRNEQKRLNGG